MRIECAKSWTLALLICCAGNEAASATVEFTYPRDYRALSSWVSGANLDQLEFGAAGKLLHQEKYIGEIQQNINRQPIFINPKTGPDFLRGEKAITPANELFLINGNRDSSVHRLVQATSYLMGMPDEVTVSTGEEEPGVPVWMVGVEMAISLCDYPSQALPMPMYDGTIRRIKESLASAPEAQKEYLRRLLGRIRPWEKLLNSIDNKLTLRKVWAKAILDDVWNDIRTEAAFRAGGRTAALSVNSIIQEGERISISAVSDSVPDGKWIAIGDEYAGIKPLQASASAPTVAEAIYLQNHWHISIRNGSNLRETPFAAIGRSAADLNLPGTDKNDPRAMTFREFKQLMEDSIKRYEEIQDIVEKLRAAYHRGESADPDTLFKLIEHDFLAQSFYAPHEVEAFWDLETLRHDTALLVGKR